MTPFTGMGLPDLARCPKVEFPAFTPRIVKSMVAARFPSPNKAIIHRMGRTKRGSDFFVQYILLGNVSPKMAAGRISAKIAPAGRPGVVLLRERYSPFGVVVRARSSTPTEFFWAKLSAARVYFP